jgi:hypothetical protein
MMGRPYGTEEAFCGWLEAARSWSHGALGAGRWWPGQDAAYLVRTTQPLYTTFARRNDPEQKSPKTAPHLD